MNLSAVDINNPAYAMSKAEPHEFKGMITAELKDDNDNAYQLVIVYFWVKTNEGKDITYYSYMPISLEHEISISDHGLHDDAINQIGAKEGSVTYSYDARKVRTI